MTPVARDAEEPDELRAREIGVGLARELIYTVQSTRWEGPSGGSVAKRLILESAAGYLSRHAAPSSEPESGEESNGH